MTLLVKCHFAEYMSFGLLRFRYSSDMTSRSLQATDMRTTIDARASAQIVCKRFG
ncbi:MAG: hypothetical protein M0R39_07365 [Prolixibacteraceae bacterium]|nr:hypothetical protein [Prolixibacteraceae bacterium]